MIVTVLSEFIRIGLYIGRYAAHMQSLSYFGLTEISMQGYMSFYFLAFVLSYLTLWGTIKLIFAPRYLTRIKCCMPKYIVGMLSEKSHRNACLCIHDGNANTVHQKQIVETISIIVDFLPQ